MLYLRKNGELKDFSLRVKVCDTFFKRLLGALPEGGINAGKALLLPGSSWIHTWFMRRAIDVAYFDSAGRILAYFPAVDPFRLLPRSPEAVGALELPPETLPENCDSRNSHLRFSLAVAEKVGYPELAVDGSP